MITTPITQLSMLSSRTLSSMPFPAIGRLSAAAVTATNAARYVVTNDATATTTHSTTVVNPWLGGGMCDNGSSHAATSFGIASKRVAPGHLEGMT